jgi:hypothetical protein
MGFSFMRKAQIPLQAIATFAWFMTKNLKISLYLVPHILDPQVLDIFFDIVMWPCDHQVATEGDSRSLNPDIRKGRHC